MISLHTKHFLKLLDFSPVEIEGLIDLAAEELSDNPNLPVLDIPALVRRLVETKYRDLWFKKGYIPADWSQYE